MLRPLLLNTVDARGGAAIATYRVHRGLRSIGVDSTMLVQVKTTDDPSVRGPETRFEKGMAAARPRVDNLPVRPYRARGKTIFSPAMVGDTLAGKIAKLNPDLVHLFWVTSGFLRPETLRRVNKPLVWTLHDMWPFTGGCHYDAECGRYRESCGACPVLGSSSNHDVSRRVWKRKHASWRDMRITVVATSRWIAECARSSSLFRDGRIEVLPNGIDLSWYKPLDKAAARHAYGLPRDKKLILFSAGGTDVRKGFHLLSAAMQKLGADGWRDRVDVVVVGASEPAVPVELGLNAHYVAHLHDEIGQILLYSAADVVVAPSLQENLSNTVMESLACGTPVVAFNVGGMPDMIRHEHNGYLVKPFSSDGLAEAIAWVLEDTERHHTLSANARKHVVTNYDVKSVARQYEALYRDILA